MDIVYVTQGQKVLELTSDDPQTLGKVVGRTGTLRAPVIRQDRVLFVGYPKKGFPELVADEDE